MATALKHQESEQLSIEIPDGARRLRVQYVPRAYVHPDPAQPRVDADDELRASIAATGILQPITVRPHPSISGAWMIVDGERRWRGAEGVQDEIPIIPRRDQEDEYLRLRTQGVANTGKAFTPLEEARMFARALELLGEDASIERVAKEFGRPRSSVSERLQLLELGPWVASIAAGLVPVSYAVRALLPLRGLPDAVHAQVIEELGFGPADGAIEGEEVESYDAFEHLIRGQYSRFMYPLAKSKRDWELQPEFDVRHHDAECACGTVEWAFGHTETRKACGNPEWWKPRQKEAKKAAKAKEATKKQDAPATVKGGKELYLPAGAATVNAGYSSTAKGVINLTDEQGRWFIGQQSDEEAFDPADLVIADAKLVLVTSQYNAPRVGTKDGAAVKVAREKWAARWAAREQELRETYADRLREQSSMFAVTGPGLVHVVEQLALLSSEEVWDDDDFAIDTYAAAVGIPVPKKLQEVWGEKREKALTEWVRALLPADLERIASAIAMGRGGVKLPAAQVREERQAAADVIRKQASPWAKKPKGSKAATPVPAAAKQSPAKKAAATKRAPDPAFMRDFRPSPELAAVVGDKPMPRTEVTKRLWDYIRKQGLQGKQNRRLINADAKLRPVFGKASLSMFEMTKAVNKHLTEIEEPKAPKKPRASNRVPAAAVQQLDDAHANDADDEIEADYEIVDGADDDDLWDSDEDEESGDARHAEDDE